MEKEVYGNSIKEMQEKCGEKMVDEEFIQNCTTKKPMKNEKLVLIIQTIIFTLYALLTIRKELKGGKESKKSRKSKKKK